MSKHDVTTMGNQDAILEELRGIRRLLTPPSSAPRPKGLLNEFKFFLSEYKVMGLAVAFIMGVYLGALVKSLVDNLVMPLVSLVIPGIDWKTIAFGQFKVGLFIGDLITFIIIAFVIFIIVRITTRIGIK